MQVYSFKQVRQFFMQEEHVFVVSAK